VENGQRTRAAAGNGASGPRLAASLLRGPRSGVPARARPRFQVSSLILADPFCSPGRSRPPRIEHQQDPHHRGPPTTAANSFYWRPAKRSPPAALPSAGPFRSSTQDRLAPSVAQAGQ
jgi:hypothetical protein